MAFVPFSIGQVSMEIAAYGVKINYPAAGRYPRPPRRVNLPTLGRFLCFSSVSNIGACCTHRYTTAENSVSKGIIYAPSLFAFFSKCNYLGLVYRYTRIPPSKQKFINALHSLDLILLYIDHKLLLRLDLFCNKNLHLVFNSE